MKKHILVGLNFGIASAAITTLGLIVGLESATSSTMVVLGGILTIAIADAFSDALGIHISQESDNNDTKQVWSATIITFLTKFLFALTFAVPFLLAPIQLAIIIDVIWGLLIVAALSFFIAKKDNKNPFWAIGEHLTIAIVVVFLTNWVGKLIAQFFK